LGMDKSRRIACLDKDIFNCDRMFIFPRAGRRPFFFF
jgi:hypothetical protein